MTANKIVQSVGTIFKDFWKWHRDVLGLMVAALAEVQRVGIAAIGRELHTQTKPKHAIKRVDSFLRNDKFDDQKAQEVLLRTVIGPRKRVLIAVDWTKIRQWDVLVAAVIQRGRGVPVLWSVMDPWLLYKSRNAFENGFFMWLAKALPEGVKAIVLLDRGFHRVELTKHLRRCGLSFVIRTGINVHVRHSAYCGPVREMVQKRGETVDLSNSTLRLSRPVRVRVIGTWSKGQREPWLLMTDMHLSTELIVAYYDKRFRIEETFRDQKDWRFGLGLGHLKMFRAQRLERMLLAVAVYHFIAMVVGGKCRRHGFDRQFRANTVRHKPTHSDFTLGKYYLLRIVWNWMILLKEFWNEPVYIFRG